MMSGSNCGGKGFCGGEASMAADGQLPESSQLAGLKPGNVARITPVAVVWKEGAARPNALVLPALENKQGESLGEVRRGVAT